MRRMDSASITDMEGSAFHGWSTVQRVESDRDTRLVAVMGFYIVFHPPREQHEQPGAGREVDIAVAVGHASLDGAVNHTRPRIAEHELAGPGRHVQIKTARQQRSLMQMQEVEAAAVM